MDIYDEQVQILYKLLVMQKERLRDSELKKKFTFILCDTRSSYYKDELYKLEKIISVCEELIITQKYQRALYYLCILKKKLDNIILKANKDFYKIQNKII